MKKRKILMLILFVSTVLLSGCGKTFLSRLFKSEHEEYVEILTAFLAAANQNDTKKIEELIAKAKDVDLDEVKDELLYKIETLQGELATLDKEKVKEIALSQAEVIKVKAEELYRYAIEKGTPAVESAANEVRKQALKVVKELEKKLEEDTKKKK